MTALTPAQLKALFETGDIPTSANYSDMFDSFLAVAEGSSQTINGNLIINGNLNVSSVTASSIYAADVNAGAVSAQIIITSVLTRTVNSSIAALGSTQASAFQLINGFNVVNAVTSAVNDGVKLSTVIGQTQVVWNRSASQMLIYPPSGGTIDSLAGNAPYKLATLTQASFINTTGFSYLSGK